MRIPIDHNSRVTYGQLLQAYQLHREGEVMAWPDLRDTVRDVVAMSRLADRVRRLNERGCNEGSSDELDAQADRIVSRANGIAKLYGATFYRYGEGSGLWPHVKTSDGRTITP